MCQSRAGNVLASAAWTRERAGNFLHCHRWMFIAIDGNDVAVSRIVQLTRENVIVLRYGERSASEALFAMKSAKGTVSTEQSL